MLDKLPQVRGQYRQSSKLKTWFDVGGAAEIIFRPADLQDLSNFIKNCPQEVPVQIIGAGSNVIIDDAGVKGVVIKLGGEFAKISQKEDRIVAGAAALCVNVATSSKNFALSKLEFLSGIPGSIGGAIAMNAGCYGSDISQTLLSATAIDRAGNIVELKNSDFGFFYRGSKISKNYFFIEGVFQCENSTAETVAQKISELSQQREKAQPIRAKTGGSTFKNPPANLSDKKAWQLIDEAGFRGKIIGDAQISEKHCNFMINRGKASAQDLIDLAEGAKKAVKEKSGVDLELEIKIIR